MRRPIIAMLLTFASAAAAQSPAEIDKGEMTLVNQAAALIVQSQPAEALPILDKVIVANQARYADEKRQVYSGQTLAMTLLNMGDAVAHKGDAVDAGPAYGQALFFKGYVLIDLDRAAEAGAFLDRAVALSPFNPQFLNEDGQWHAKRGDLDQALALYHRAEADVALAPEDAQTHIKAVTLRGEGFVLTDMGKLDEAEARYRASLAIEPNNSVSINELKYIRQRRAELAGKKTT